MAMALELLIKGRPKVAKPQGHKAMRQGLLHKAICHIMIFADHFDLAEDNKSNGGKQWKRLYCQKAAKELRE
jgi:hypothetical protein